MSHRDPADDTMHTVRGRFQQWSEQNPRPRGRSAIHMPAMSDDVEKLVGTGLGFGSGALLLLLAAVTFYAAGTWREIGRDGAAVAYTIAAFFLTLAGGGALAATWNHLFRVMPGEDSHH